MHGLRQLYNNAHNIKNLEHNTVQFNKSISPKNYNIMRIEEPIINSHTSKTDCIKLGCTVICYTAR